MLKTHHVLALLSPLFVFGFACSPKEEEIVEPPVAEPSAVEDVAVKAEVGPPLIAQFPEQPTGPAPKQVQTVPGARFKLPPNTSGEISMADARLKAQFFATDSRSPIVNGNFERWEKPGPIHWEGNFTYKNPGDPPDADIQMFPSTVDGEWALRMMPKGTDLEIWQDVTLPEIDGAITLDITAYVKNPVPAGFAIRLVYVAEDTPGVVEVYPAQADNEWTRFHALAELPANVEPSSLRLYLTRAPSVRGNVIVDGVSVFVRGAQGAAALAPSSNEPAQATPQIPDIGATGNTPKPQDE